MSTTVRRKKTNAEIKADRQRREREQQLQRESMDWGDLRKMHGECSELMVTTNKSIAEVLKTPGLSQKLGDEAPRVVQVAKQMANDTKNYRQTLKDIASKYEGKEGLAKGMSNTMTAIVIGEEYQQLMDSFQTVVVQPANEILRIVEDSYFPEHKAAEATTQGDSNVDVETE